MTDSSAMTELTRWVRGSDLTARELHDLLELRTAVFVVEQNCPYQEVDGLDLRADTEHGWRVDAEGITVAARILGGGDTPQVGRVVTRADCRGRGLAALVVNEAHARAGAAGTRLEAQSHLVGWYETLGWVVGGEAYVEDGIPHTPMRRRG